MVNKPIIGAACACLVVASFNSSSEMVSMDLNAPGDGLITLDTATGLEWLDLSVTDGLTVQTALAENEGFSLATKSQFSDMIYGFYPDIEGTENDRGFVQGTTDATHIETAHLYFDLFGITTQYSNSTELDSKAYGWYDDFGAQLNGGVFLRDYFDENTLDYSDIYSADPREFSTDYQYSVSSPNMGTYLVRASVLTPVVIDIKPSKKPENIIDLKKDKNLKVAIVGEEVFDALQVDPATVKFDSNKASPASPIRFKGQDYNRDGFPDLILTFKLKETGIACGDTTATLNGSTYGGEAIVGSDNFIVEPCP